MLLSIKDLYAGVEDKKILNGVNLDVNKGEVHVIMGPNGSGKSTLANVIMNTGGYNVESGKIIFKDEDITDVDTDKSCLLYTSPSPRDVEESRMPSSA